MNSQIKNTQSKTQGKHNPFAFGELECAVDSTESQREVWLASQFGDDANCSFNESVFVHLNGKLNDAALEQALQDLTLRHQSLRGCFSSDGHQMVFYKDRVIPLQHHNYTAQTSSEAQARFQTLCKEAVSQPFDLFNGPLARFDLIEFAPEQQSLLLTFHHSVCDGWSLYVIADELGHLYSARCDRRNVDLPPAPSFAGYSCWERGEETAQLRANSLRYWQEKYSNGAPSLELPYDNPRPLQRSFAAQRLDKPLSMELIAQLKSLAAAKRSTLNTTLMAGFAAYLHKLSGSNEIVLGIPFAGQMAKEEHALIGHCVNIIPLYIQFSGSETFSELVAKVQKEMLDAFEYQYLTYGTLLQTIDANRDPSKPSLVSVIFNVDQAGEASDSYTGLEMNFSSNPRVYENFDINLNITLSAKAAVMECTFNTSLWRSSTLERRLTELQKFLERVRDNPDFPLRKIDLILASDRQTIMRRWDEVNRDYDLEHQSLHGLIEKAVDRYPDNVAIIADNTSLTYKQLDEQANRLAHYLIAQGVGAESLVPLMMERSLEMVVAINAVLKAGGAYLPLDPEHPAERIDYILQEAGACIVLTQTAFVSRLPDTVKIMAVNEAAELLAAQPTTRPQVSIKPQQLAYVIYTSGSTGKPKGVMNEHQAICSQMMWMDEVYALQPNDSVVQKTPYTFDVSLWELFLPLMSGSLLVMAKPDGHKEASYLIDLVNQHKITHIHFVPSMLYLFLQEANQQRCPSLRRFILSGEAVTKDLEQRFTKAFADVECWNLYGPTEAAVHATSWLCCQGDSLNTVPIGRPVSNTRLYVVDENLKLQPPGVPGELLIAGVQVARGYVNRPDLTEQRFIADPFVAGAGRVYRTGDLVRLRDDGVIEYIGRNDFQVKVRGLRIELGEIEAVIKQFFGISQCVVLAREDRANDQRLVAYLVTEDGSAPDSAHLRDHIRLTLPDYMVPQHFVILATMPLTSSGKVDRNVLPAPEVGDISADNLIAPENSIEEQLLTLWREILGVEKMGVTNDFFDLGGHSLLGTQMFARIKSLFSVNIGLRKLFEAPTVRQLAVLIQQESQSGNRVAKIQPRKQDEPVQATSQQQVWYLLEQIEPDSFAYNLPAAFRLQGQLNLQAVQKALDTIEQRHQILRAGFRNDTGLLLLDIHDSLKLDLSPKPLSYYGVNSLDDLKLALRQEAAKPFDTVNGPLFKANLIALGENDHVLSLLIHHLVFDGWSFDLLLKEICTLYNAFAQGLPNPLPLLPVQYPDYALWQKTWLESDLVKKQLSYWTQQLSGELPVLNLPLDKERPRTQAHRSGGINFFIDEPLLQKLEELGNRHGATLFMVILALYVLMLYRYSRQTDILVNVPIYARNQAELSGLMGPMINLLVCRFAVKPQRTFVSWLQDVKKIMLDAIDNQDVQFETLVRTINPPRDPSRPPMAQTLFSYQDVRNRSNQMDGILRSQIDIDRMGVQTDLDVWLKRQVRGLEGGIEYPIELFNKVTAETFGQSLVESARNLAVNPEAATVAELTRATTLEQNRVSHWNTTDMTFEYDQGFLSDFKNVAAIHPDKEAVIAENGKYSYAELEQRSNQFAHYLQAQGLLPNSLVGVLLQRTIDLPAVVLAIWKLGAAYVPLDPSYPPERVATILGVAKASLVVTDTTLQGAITDFTGSVAVIDTDSAEILAHSSDTISLAISPDQLAYVIFTSGSTGIPKGVEITQGALHNFLHAVKYEPGFNADDRLLAITTLAFDISLLELFLPLLSGATVVLASQEQSNNAHALKQLIDEFDINVLQATPASWRLLLGAGWRAPNTFKGLVGGEKLARDLAAELLAQGVELWNMYGPTEATVWTSCYQVAAPEAGELPQIYIGRPLANTQLHILDAQGVPLPVGAYGELWIGGVGLARGYRGDPKQTAERFVVNADGVRLYRTGDFARWTLDGLIEFGDRLDNQIKLRGFRIELEEIELRLRSHPDIQDTAVVLQDFGGNDQRLVAHIVYAAGEMPTNTELRKHLRQSLPDYMLPQQFNVLEKLPLLASGKVNRKHLSQPLTTTINSAGVVPPNTATEKKLAAMWQVALKRDQISIDDQFIDIGGHSLLALQVIMEMEASFGVRVMPQDMWVNTLEQLSALIDRSLAAQTETLQPPSLVANNMSDKKTRGLFSKLFGMSQ
jgi:amino acid adenylation domain-containing protein